MAVLLNTSNYLQNTSNEDWGNAGTIFLRIKPNWNQADGIDHHFLFKSNATFAGSNGLLFDKYTNGSVYIGWFAGGDSRVNDSAAGAFISGVTHNHLFTWDTTIPTQQYWVNGGFVVQRTDAFSVPTGLTHFTLGCLYAGSPTLSGDSSMAEFGRWNRILLLREILILERTGCPLSVPQGLRQYHPLIHPIMVGSDLMGRVPLTVTGSPTATAHPRVFYPASGYVALSPVTLAAQTIEPPVVANPFQTFAPMVSIAGVLAPPVVAAPFQIFAPLVGSDAGIAPPVVSNAFTVYAPTVYPQETTIQEDSRELEPHNLKVRIVDFVGGDDLRITRTYTELAGGILINKAYLTIKRRAKDDTDAQAIVQKTITAADGASGQILDNDTTGGSIHLFFDLTKDDTAALTPLIAYHYDVQVITIGNAVYTCEIGTITMRQGVTHAST
jgi:hypothetical protein